MRRIIIEELKHSDKQLSIPAICIDDGLIPSIQVNDIVSKQTRLRVIKQVKSVFSECDPRNAKNAFLSQTIIKTTKTTNTVNNIIDELLKNHKLIVNLVAICSYDDYTFEHSINVCILAVLTGISMGFSRVKLSYLGMAALLHDLGKTLVPKSILNKPGALTEEEFEEIKKHTCYGHQILSSNPDVSRVCAVTTIQHHEHYNGEGYPNGLKGSEINEFARIVGVADVYDALTADRVYRKAYPPHKAYEMIASSGNFLFAFDVVQAFLQNVTALGRSASFMSDSLSLN